MTQNSILRKISVVLVFVAGLVAGAGGLWLIVQYNDGLRDYLLEHPARDWPQARVAEFVRAIARSDESAAHRLWEIYEHSPDDVQSDLTDRRDAVLAELAAAGISPDYKILEVEWWTTCCEPSVTCDVRNAGGARMRVQFLAQDGTPVLYMFDVFSREQPYWGDAAGNPPRDWVIRDVYPYQQEPLFWTLVYESQARFVHPQGEP